MKTEILKALQDSKEYLSGQELCDRFQVSRTAVWKVINQLREEGYIIEAKNKAGYRLISSPDLLTTNEVRSKKTTTWTGCQVVCMEKVDSTNNEVKRLSDEGAPHGTLVIAESQTAGKGRRGRVWASPERKAIYMSLLLKPEFAPDKASMLTLVMAISTAKAIEDVTKMQAMIKWPNDIVVNKKKIVGILTEMNMEADYIKNVIIGIGINVNQQEFPEEISQTASSLFIEGGESYSRTELIWKTMEYFEKYYALFLQKTDLSLLQEEYEQHLINLGKQVRVLDPKGEFNGIAKGIRPTGELVVEREDGNYEKIYAGEVSVRGVYGYV